MVTTATQHATPSPVVVPDDAAGVLAALRDARARRRQAEVDQVLLALHWAAIHATDDHQRMDASGAPLDLAGDGTPWVQEFCLPELASVLGLSTDAGRSLVRDALDLAHRLPRVWGQVVRPDGSAGRLDVHRARKIAQATNLLSASAASWVDGQIWWAAHRMSWTQLHHLVADAISRFMPSEAERIREQASDARHVDFADQVNYSGTVRIEAEVDVADAMDLQAALARRVEQGLELGSPERVDVLRAKALGEMARRDLTLEVLASGHVAATSVPATLYVHVSAEDLLDVAGDSFGTARIESHGPATLDTVRTWLTEWLADEDAARRVVVKPVIDLAERVHVGQYEIPDRLREQIRLRDLSCVFPWCTRPARRTDADHIVAYNSGGETSSDNLACLCRHHHRLKTHSPWTYTAVEPGVFLWRSPHGYRYLRNHHGTEALN